MMNLLARILSHGFALAVVVLIAIILMYRGDLFPEWDLPEFLVVKGKPDTTTGAASGTVERLLPEALVTSPESTTGLPLEAPPAEAPPEEAPLVAAPLEEAPPVEAPPVEAPPVEAPPVEAPPVEAPPVEAPPVEAPPEEAPPVEAPPVEAPPVEAPPVEAPPVEAPPVEAPQVEVPHEEASQAEAPRVEATGAVMAQDEVSYVEEVVLDAVDESSQISVSATTASTESDETVPQTPNVPGQSEEKQVAASATATMNETVTEQPDSALPDMASSIPAAEPEPVPASATSLESKAGKTAYESLAAAREAYWLRDYDEAENYYRQLIQLEPENPDWYGELGNMYFAQGQWQQAAAVYYEAGVHLLNEGKVEQARQMVDVIRGLNGVEADDLENQVNASQVAP